jgi:serine/threonine protein kinase
MNLGPGTRLGPYEIVALIGTGGMGEVYKARDHRLGRDVAVKVVTTDGPADPSLLARLESEARAAASLNHPNIVAVFDVGTHDGAPYIVSELLDGETLRARLAGGALPVRKSVECAGQLADALAAAHAKGIVHRDLKPENIVLTRDGRAKILDFGLAKTGGDAAAAATGAATAVQTLPGVVMGTVGYMSPEQVAGRPVDHRTDIFSLGAVVDEMVTGRRTFQRPTAAQTMTAILESDTPAASTVNPAVPSSLDRIILRCLEKSPTARFQSASDLSFALLALADSSAHPMAAPARRTSSRQIAALAIGAIAAAVAGAGATWFAVRSAGESITSRPKHFTIDVQATPLSESQVPLSLSPDGTKLVFSAGSYQGAQLYLRSLDRPDPQPIPGTLDAFDPFFSPDGQWIAFFTTDEVKKVPLSGGPVVTICRTANLVRGSAAWSTDGTIYFASSGGTTAGILSVSSNGGVPQQVTTLASGESAHRWPTLLPGGRTILFTVAYGGARTKAGSSFQNAYRVVAKALDSGAQQTVMEGASFARYLPTGHLLYVKGDALLATHFDLRSLQANGSPVVVSDQIAVNDSASAQLTVSAEGTFAYVPRAALEHRALVWVDRSGATTQVGLGQRWFDYPRLSADGGRIAVSVRENGQKDIWVQERASPALSRLTFDGTSDDGQIWTPDGQAITYSTLQDGKTVMISQDVEGNRASHVIFSTGHSLWPGSWSRDGQTLAFMELVNAGDVSVIRQGDVKATPFADSAATEWGARLSPDDRWIAYTSNASGRWEVYVKPYPGPGERRQISTDGGAEIVWGRNGRELFYRNGPRLMAVDVVTQPAFSAGTPRAVFETPFARGEPGLPNYDVAPDGRFLMIKPGDTEAAPRPIHIVINWFDELRRIAAGTH